MSSKLAHRWAMHLQIRRRTRRPATCPSKSRSPAGRSIPSNQATVSPAGWFSWAEVGGVAAAGTKCRGTPSQVRPRLPDAVPPRLAHRRARSAAPPARGRLRRTPGPGSMRLPQRGHAASFAFCQLARHTFRGYRFLRQDDLNAAGGQRGGSETEGYARRAGRGASRRDPVGSATALAGGPLPCGYGLVDGRGGLLFKDPDDLGHLPYAFVDDLGDVFASERNRHTQRVQAAPPLTIAPKLGPHQLRQR